MEINYQLENFLNQLNKYRDVLILGGFGVILTMIGINEWFKGKSPEPLNVETEAFSSDTNDDGVYGDVVVDISGAVNQPGVYRFSLGTRTGMAIEAAQGLHPDADQVYISQTLNLASELQDGSKIYIPFAGESSQNSSNSNTLIPGTINMNTSTQAELESLTGIGESRAKTIIQNRPYSNTEELNSKAKVPKSVIENIKNSISF